MMSGLYVCIHEVSLNFYEKVTVTTDAFLNERFYPSFKKSAFNQAQKLVHIYYVRARKQSTGELWKMHAPK